VRANVGDALRVLGAFTRLMLPVRDPLPLLHDVYYTMSRQMTPESSTLVNTF